MGSFRTAKYYDGSGNSSMEGGEAGIVHAAGRGYLKVIVETINRNFYDTVRVQEFIFLPQELVEAFGQINTFFANHMDSENIAISFSIVSEELNRTAEYLVRYGLENLDPFAEAPMRFGNLQFYLDRDMGVA